MTKDEIQALAYKAKIKPMLQDGRWGFTNMEVFVDLLLKEARGPVVAQISPNITSAIEEWKQLGGEIIRNEPPSAQLPPLPKNLHSLAGNIWCSICEWADAEPGAEASAAAEQINKALEEEMIAYAKQALRLNGVNV